METADRDDPIDTVTPGIVAGTSSFAAVNVPVITPPASTSPDATTALIGDHKSAPATQQSAAAASMDSPTLSAATIATGTGSAASPFSTPVKLLPHKLDMKTAPALPSLTPPRVTPTAASSSFQARKALGEAVVEIKNLTKSFTLEGRSDVVRALRNINLTANSECSPIKRGEFVMIRGPSGGGKTTLLNIIGTIDEPTSGSVSIFNSIVDSKSTDSYLASLRLNKIGFVFQTFNLLATLSAFENVLLPLTIAGRHPAKACRARALQLLSLVGLADRVGHLPSELSGGEQQRVTIARALANEPELLLLDEPTGDLDTRNTIDIMDLILDINISKKTTCIMVTHNPDLECYADRILYVQDGAFQKQALNEVQSRLDYDLYMKHVGEDSK